MATGPMANKNNKEDIPEPWRVDLQGLKGFENWLFVLISATLLHCIEISKEVVDVFLGYCCDRLPVLTSFLSSVLNCTEKTSYLYLV